MKKLWAVVLAALMVSVAFAQAKGQRLILEFVEGDEVTIVGTDGSTASYGSGILEGDEIKIGSAITTGASTTVELKITPNGTILKLAASTTFRIASLASDSKQMNAFELVAGKVRTVAAKGGSYEIRSASTVCGVRGTDFSYSFVKGVANTLLVGKGRVDFSKLGGDGKLMEQISVGAGEFADFFAESFKASPFTPEQYAQEYGNVEFKKLDPKTVAEADGTESGQDGTAATGETGTAEPPAPEPAAKSALLSWLSDMLGMEIGSLTIDGVTYSKAVIQPTFEFGKLKMALYLPIIYTSDLFDPSDWYRPYGNDEWSFGYDKDWAAHPIAAAADAASDLALKFKYIEYGRQLDDPFFVKLGNLNSFTVGHGLIMNEYANDADFPAVRKLGVNLGLDLKSWGFEAMVNDAIKPEIFGGRLYARPLGESIPLAFGLSAVADIAPASILDTEATPDASDAVGDPIFIGTALDVDLPIIPRNTVFGIRFFTDLGAMLPYVRNDAGGTMDTGLRWDMIIDADSKSLKNWGLTSGFMGNLFFVDWRLEYRHFTGAFTPGFFNASYDRTRGIVAQKWAGYLDGSTPLSDAPTVMGIYGEGEGKLFGDKISLTLGYFMPWSFDAGLSAAVLDEVSRNDYFVSRLEIKKGLIPVVDVYGAISYERHNFYRTLTGLDSGASLFDEQTVLKGEVIVPVPKAPGLDLAIVFATAVRRNDAGDVMYKDGKPEIIPVLSLETRLSF
ncbi:MAG: FecR family protein [Spirochaetes bacterium]|nr:FecR family protein [Spirochaetota bacterium]